jgi:radical SAM superfamily enzyme YgiQ (UPF0313 family)
VKILIIFSRSLGSDGINYSYLFPLGLGYISSVLKQAGHKVDILNLNHRRGTVENLIREALEIGKRYDFVCTGGLSAHYSQIKIISKAVRSSGTIVGLIVGGGLISSEPELMFNVLNPDFIVIGEGEKAITELLSCLDKGGDLSNVLGIGYRDSKGKFVCNKPQPAIMDLDSLPLPDFEGFEFETYLNNQKPTDMFSYDLHDFPRVYPIICSRSCPYLCTFCFHPLGNKYRQRSIDNIMQELEYAIKRYRINNIAIYDELFSHDRERVYEFCRRIKELFKQVSWECKWGCQMRVDGLDEELLRTLKDAGCYMVSYGFESYSPTVLKSMKKSITPKQIDQAVHSTLKYNLSIQANFIFGDRAETMETAQETLNYWKNNIPAGIILAFINPYPGTALYKNCVERGVIKDKIDFIENHIFDVINMTDEMTDSEFEKLKLDIFEAELKYRICAIPVSLKKRKDTGTYNILVKCPHCNNNIEYKNYIIKYKSFLNLMMYCRQCRRRFFLVSRLYHYLTKSYLLLSPFMSRRMKIAASNAKGRAVKIRYSVRRGIKRIFNRFFYNV